MQNLQNANRMFKNCKWVNTHIRNLPKCVTARSMFDGSGMVRFYGNAVQLKAGCKMFYNCEGIRFVGETPSLLDSTSMFENCKDILGWKGNLASLDTGVDMFKGSFLAVQMLKSVSSTIKSWRNIKKFKHQIHTGNVVSFSSSEEAIADFYRRVEYLKLAYKWWKVFDENGCITWDQDESKTIDEVLEKDEDFLDKTEVVELFDELLNGDNFLASQISPLYENETLEKFAFCADKMTSAIQMFCLCVNLTECYAWAPNLIDAFGMYYGCKNLSYIEGDFSKVEDGTEMFYGCSSLNEIEFDFPSLKCGYGMFNGCDSLLTFISNIENLENGENMFKDCSNLKDFTQNIQGISNGNSMFEGCSSLSIFNSQLNELLYGDRMFKECSNLTSFSIELPKLISGDEMFKDCHLDEDSTILILGSLQDVSEITGIHKFWMTTYSEELTQEMLILWMNTQDKGWDLTFNFQNLTGSKTFNLDGIFSLQNMFYNCVGLTEFKGNVASVISAENIFSGCKNLTYVDFYDNINYDVLVQVIESLPVCTTGGNTIKINPLTPNFQELVTMANEKGWVTENQTLHVTLTWDEENKIWVKSTMYTSDDVSDEEIDKNVMVCNTSNSDEVTIEME